MVLVSLIYLIATGKFKQIDYKFLVSGHTYLPCDRDFAQIEKRKRLSKLYIPEHIEKMIAESCHKNLFQVIYLEDVDFKNLQILGDEYINTTNKMNISQASWIRITANKPFQIQVRKKFSEAVTWNSVNVLKKRKNLNNFKLQAFTPLQCRNRITADKLKYLKSMLDYIPLSFRNFYEKLIDRTTQQGVEH